MQDEYSTPAAKTQVLIDIAPNGKPRPWRARHRQGLMLSEVYSALGDVDQARAAVYLNKAKRLESCAQVAEFRRLDDGSLRLHNGSFCRVRLCPMCQWRRSLKLGAQVRQVVERANAEHIKDTGAPWRWLMVTYTVRNVDGPDLAIAIDTIHKGLNNMAKCARWRGAVRGWLRATEVTHNTNEHSASYDTYHPHMHMLLCVPAGYMSGKGYIRQREWAQLWGHYVKVDYTPVVDVRVIKPDDGTRLSDLPAGEQAAAMGKACAEVSKYAAKPADYIIPGDITLSMSAVQTLDTMLDKRRMTAWGGILKDIAKSLQLDDIETGDLVHIDEDASADYTAEQIAQYVTYNWSAGVGDYTKIAERAGDTPEVERKRKRADRAAVKSQTAEQQRQDNELDTWTVSAYRQSYPGNKWMQAKATDELRHLPRRVIDSRISDMIGALPDGWEHEEGSEDNGT